MLELTFPIGVALIWFQIIFVYLIFFELLSFAPQATKGVQELKIEFKKMSKLGETFQGLNMFEASTKKG